MRLNDLTIEGTDRLGKMLARFDFGQYLVNLSLTCKEVGRESSKTWIPFFDATKQNYPRRSDAWERRIARKVEARFSNMKGGEELASQKRSVRIVELEMNFLSTGLFEPMYKCTAYFSTEEDIYCSRIVVHGRWYPPMSGGDDYKSDPDTTIVFKRSSFTTAKSIIDTACIYALISDENFELKR